jgi:hypothetical protein
VLLCGVPDLQHNASAPHATTCRPNGQVALAKLVLKRVLLLAALLDRALAAPSRPPGAPLLFRRDSKLKASSQVGA